MEKASDKYWYVYDKNVLCVEKDGFVVALQKGEIVTGVLHEGDTEATSVLEVKGFGHWRVYGKVELPLDRFRKFDIDHAWMEE